MTEYAPETHRLVAFNESNAVRVALDTLGRVAQNSNRISEHPEGRTAASQPERIVRTIRPYTEEELAMLEEADRFPPDLHEQVRAFLEG